MAQESRSPQRIGLTGRDFIRYLVVITLVAVVAPVVVALVVVGLGRRELFPLLWWGVVFPMLITASVYVVGDRARRKQAAPPPSLRRLVVGGTAMGIAWSLVRIGTSALFASLTPDNRALASYGGLGTSLLAGVVAATTFITLGWWLPRGERRANADQSP